MGLVQEFKVTVISYIDALRIDPLMERLVTIDWSAFPEDVAESYKTVFSNHTDNALKGNFKPEVFNAFARAIGMNQQEAKDYTDFLTITQRANRGLRELNQLDAQRARHTEKWLADFGAWQKREIENAKNGRPSLLKEDGTFKTAKELRAEGQSERLRSNGPPRMPHL